MSEQDKIRANRAIAYCVIFITAIFADVGWIFSNRAKLETMDFTLGIIAAFVLLLCSVFLHFRINKILKGDNNGNDL